MQSSRQKKRVSQQKKKYHSRAKMKAEGPGVQSNEAGKASISTYVEKEAAPAKSRVSG